MNFARTTQMSGASIIHVAYTEIKRIFSTKVKLRGFPPVKQDNLKF